MSVGGEFFLCLCLGIDGVDGGGGRCDVFVVIGL